MEEVWKDIEGYEGLYQVSNLGRIKSVKRIVNCKNEAKLSIKEKILIQAKGTRGYKFVRLSKNNKSKTIRVHKIVAKAFIPNKNNGKVINHLDCNVENNCVSNLEWCTQSENVKYSWKLGRCEISRKALLENSKNRRKKINQYDLNGKFIQQYSSMIEASRKFNIKYQNISDCCRNIIKKSGGYIWRYADD